MLRYPRSSLAKVSFLFLPSFYGFGGLRVRVSFKKAIFSAPFSTHGTTCTFPLLLSYICPRELELRTVTELGLNLTAGPGLSDTEFLSENPGFWPNLVQMVSITLKVTTTQNDPQRVPLGATRGHPIFYYMKIEGSKPAIYEWVKKLWFGGLKGGPKDFQKDAKKLDPALFWSTRAHQTFFALIFSMIPRGFPT